MTDPPCRRRRWNIPLSPWRGDSPVHLGPLIDFPWRTLQVGKDRGAGPGMVNALYVISVNKSCARTNALAAKKQLPPMRCHTHSHLNRWMKGFHGTSPYKGAQRRSSIDNQKCFSYIKMTICCCCWNQSAKMPFAALCQTKCLNQWVPERQMLFYSACRKIFTVSDQFSIQ